MKKILVIGSCNVDQTLFVDNFPSSKETIIGKSLTTSFGGKGFNQLFAVSKTGLDVTFMYMIGDDQNGYKIQEFIENNHIKGVFNRIKNCNSGHASIIVDDSGENEIVVIPGANHRFTKEFIDSNIEHILNSDVVILQNEINMDVNRYIVEKCKSLNKIIVYNPAPYIEMDDNFYNGIDYLIPNEVELSKISKSKVDPSNLYSLFNACNEIKKKGVKNIIVTLGKYGCYLFNDNHSELVPGVEVNCIDSSAAGDTFTAYFVYGLLNDFPLKEAALFANKAAAITCTRKGTLIAIPNLDEIK